MTGATAVPPPDTRAPPCGEAAVAMGALAGAFAGLFRVDPRERRHAELSMKAGVAVSVDIDVLLQAVAASLRIISRAVGGAR